MKKKIIFISIIIILISVISFILIKNNKTNLKYELETINEINYMVFSENNKFGVINKSGEVVVESLYDKIQIPNPAKPLFICMYNYNLEKEQYNIKVLNDKNEQILYQYVVVEAIDINVAQSITQYEKSVLKYKENGKYGLIDFSGNIIVKAKYEEINGLDYKEGLLLVKKNGKYGVININGATVVKAKYDEIESDGYYEEETEYEKLGFIVGKKSGDNCKYGYINYEGKKILDNKYNQIDRIPNINKTDDIYIVAFENEKAGFYKNNENIIKHDYEDIAYDSNNNCLILQKDSKQGISDLEGNTMIDINYDNIFISGKYINAQKGENIDIYDYSTKQKLDLENIIGLHQTSNDNYVIAITNEEKYKIIDNSKNEIKEDEYDYLEYLYDDCFIAVTNEKFGIVDSDGKKIYDFKYDYLQKIENTQIIEGVVIEKYTTDLLLLDTVVASMKNASMYVEDNYIMLVSDIDIKYIGFNGDILENTKIFDTSLYAFKQNGKWGFVNKNNENIIKAEYDFVTEFDEYGFAGVKKGNKWGVINKSADVVVEPTYVLDIPNPKFVGKYYEKDIGYGEKFFTCENEIE